jgi:predicted secreted protein
VKIGSALAIYFLFFTITAFLLLPFGVRTAEEVGEKAELGHAESAPHRFDLRRHLIRSAIVSAVLFALFYLNFVFGWITAEDLDFYN